MLTATVTVGTAVAAEQPYDYNNGDDYPRAVATAEQTEVVVTARIAALIAAFTHKSVLPHQHPQLLL